MHQHSDLHLHYRNQFDLLLLGKFLLNMQFEWIGLIEQHSDLHLHYRNQFDLLMLGKFLLNMQFEWIGQAPKMH